MTERAPIATEAYRALPGRRCSAAVFLLRVPAGFPSPADDHLIGRKSSMFFVRVAGHSMTDAGIHDDDILVVDRVLEPTAGAIVVAALDGELTVKRYCVREGGPVSRIRE